MDLQRMVLVWEVSRYRTKLEELVSSCSHCWSIRRTGDSGEWWAWCQQVCESIRSMQSIRGMILYSCWRMNDHSEIIPCVQHMLKLVEKRSVAIHYNSCCSRRTERYSMAQILLYCRWTPLNAPVIIHGKGCSRCLETLWLDWLANHRQASQQHWTHWLTLLRKSVTFLSPQSIPNEQ